MRKSKIEKATIDLIDIAKLVIVAMVLIVLVYTVAASLIGQIPATIGSVILGLAGVFTFVTNNKIRQEILNWGK